MSRGVRIPDVLLRQAELGEDVELRAEKGRIIIERAARPRSGWAAAAAAMREVRDDAPLLDDDPTAFDDTGWEWPRR
jgi:antitoxin component of MazEF toxin-antitoxin module